MIIRSKGNQLFLYGTIWEGDGVYFLDALSRIDGTFHEIELHVHTNGGSVFDGNLIYNSMLNAKSPVDMYIDGIAASMGAVLSLAARKVYMVENGFLMIHEPSGGTWGNAKQHENNASLLRSIEKNFIKKICAKTGLSEVEARKWLDGDNWFSAEEALKAKLIDGIIDPVATAIDTEESGTANLQSRYNSFAALLAFDVNNSNNNEHKNPLEMKKEVISKFGLTGVNEQSSDTAVIQALEDHFKNKTATLETSLTAKTAELTNLETAVNAQRDAQIKSMLDVAEAGKKITTAQRETYENIGKTSGITALETVLTGLGARASISSHINGAKGEETITAREGWDWDKYQKEDPRGLEAMAQSDAETFGKLYEAKFKKPFNTNTK